MALTTYATLQVAVADLLNRSDLTDVIPDWVDLVEAELNRILEGRPMRTELDVDFDTTGRLTVPTDFLRPVTLILNTDLYKWPVEVKPYEFLVQKQQQLVNGPPRYVTLVGDQFILAPTPDSTYAGVLVYDAVLAPLSDTQTTNWVLTKYPDVYLYGCAFHSAPYLKDEERMAMWESLYRKAVDQIRVIAQQSEFGVNTPICRPVSALGV